jgi:hypothetical protein
MIEKMILEFLTSLSSAPASKEQRDEFRINVLALEALSWDD